MKNRISQIRGLLAVCIVLNVFVLVSSCKKGEDDPEFSVLSRKARVAGDWTMTEGSVTLGFKDASGVYPAQKFSLKKDAYTRDDIGNGAHFEGQHSLTLSITKKGALVMKQIMDSLNFEYSGSWTFMGKTSDSKNREKISIQLNKANNSLGIYRLFNKSLQSFSYRIKELRNKKMVLSCKEESLDLNSSYSVYVTSEYTFEQ